MGVAKIIFILKGFSDGVIMYQDLQHVKGQNPAFTHSKQYFKDSPAQGYCLEVGTCSLQRDET